MRLSSLLAAAALARGVRVDVTDFGADPTGGADATAALQAALDAAARNASAAGLDTTASGATEIFFPSGTYAVSSTLNFSHVLPRRPRLRSRSR